MVYLIVATIPGAIAGLALEKYAESAFRDPKLIAVVLIVMGVVLWLVDKAAARARPIGAMRWTDALLIGLAQMFAIVPGVSRSGSTITAGRALRLTRERAPRLSFLMSMPIIAAAAVLKVPQVLRTEGVSTPLVVGVVASAVSGWVAIRVLLLPHHHPELRRVRRVPRRRRPDRARHCLQPLIHRQARRSATTE